MLCVIPLGAVFEFILTWFITLRPKTPALTPNSLNFENVVGAWSDISTPTDDSIDFYRMGRVCTCFILIGFFGILIGVRM